MWPKCGRAPGALRTAGQPLAPGWAGGLCLVRVRFLRTGRAPGRDSHFEREEQRGLRDDQYFGDGTVQDPLVAGEKGGGQVTPHTCWMYFCRLETEHYRQHERKCMPRSRLIQGCSAQDQEELEAPVAARCTQGKLSRNKASYLATMVLGASTSILTTRHHRWLST
jgi:hypothetical protein